MRFIVPFPPGGTADVLGRIVSIPLTQALGQSVIIDNRPGADGAIAAEITVKAQPDGHTIFMGTNSPMSAVPSLRKKPPYDPVMQFTPIASLGRPVFFLFVHPSVPARSVDELVQYARANPGKLAYGTGNTTAIVATAQLKLLTRLDIIQVPYKGDAPTTADLMSGRVQMAFMGTIPGYQQARDGRLRILATLLTQRSSPSDWRVNSTRSPGARTSASSSTSWDSSRSARARPSSAISSRRSLRPGAARCARRAYSRNNRSVRLRQ